MFFCKTECILKKSITMKLSLSTISIVLFLSLLSCSTTQNRDKASSSNTNNSNIVITQDLPRYLNNLSRLSVRGSGSSAEVTNTTVSTISGTTAPLFVLDGVQMGRSLSSIMRILDNNQAITVEFLTNRRATIRYGEEGRNGVIILERVEGK